MERKENPPLPTDPELWEAFAITRAARLAREELNRRAQDAIRLNSPLRFTQSSGGGVARTEVGFDDDWDYSSPPSS